MKTQKIFFLILLIILVIVGVIMLALFKWVRPGMVARFDRDGVDILVQPYGSGLFIDDEFIGDSPQRIRVDPGRYSLSVRGSENGSLLWDTLIQVCPRGPEKISQIISPRTNLVHQAFRASGINWGKNNALVYFDFFEGAIKKIHTVHQVETHPTGIYLSSLTLNPSASSILGFHAGVYGDLPLVYEFDSNELVELEYLSLCGTWLPSGEAIALLGYQDNQPLDEPLLFEVDLESGSATSHVLEREFSCQSIAYSSSGDWFFYHNGMQLQLHLVKSGYSLEELIEDARLVAMHPNEDLVAWVSTENEIMIQYLGEAFDPQMLGTFHQVSHMALLDDWIYFFQLSDDLRSMSYWRLNYVNGALQLVLPSNLVLGQILEIKTSPDHSLVAYINHVDALYVYFVGH